MARAPRDGVVWVSMHRILLVDDSRSVRRMLEASLQPWGFEVQHAENGAKALALLRASPVDLVFLDINMPVLDGPSLLRLMRAQKIAAKVVLVTSGATAPVVSATVKLGASEYISKPFTPQQVRDVTERVLGLDLRRMARYEPRVLLQYGEEGFGRALRDLLPEYVAIDSTPLLAEALELAEASAYDLVLLDERVQEGALLLREHQPLAGIFAVTAGVAGALDPALDGHLPAALDEELVKGFLYSTFLRPLVFAEGGALRAAGFEGPPEYFPAYFRQLSRGLRSRAAREASVAPDVPVDLRRAPPDPVHFPALVRDLRAHLDELGGAPAFCLSSEQRALLDSAGDAATLVFVDLGE